MAAPALVTVPSIIGLFVIGWLVPIDQAETAYFHGVSAIEESGFPIPWKRCTLPHGDVELPKGRYNADGDDILNTCDTVSDGWGMSSKLRLDDRFASTSDILAWCYGPGKSEYPDFQDPARACRWSFTIESAWIDEREKSSRR